MLIVIARLVLFAVGGLVVAGLVAVFGIMCARRERWLG